MINSIENFLKINKGTRCKLTKVKKDLDVLTDVHESMDSWVVYQNQTEKNINNEINEEYLLNMSMLMSQRVLQCYRGDVWNVICHAQ